MSSDDSLENGRKRKERPEEMNSYESHPKSKKLPSSDEDESVATIEPVIEEERPKKLVKTTRETKKPHRELILQSMRAVIYGCIHIINNHDTKKNGEFIALPSLIPELASLIDVVFPNTFDYDHIEHTLEPLRRRAVQSLPPEILTLGVTQINASDILNSGNVDAILAETLIESEDDTRSYQIAIQVLKSCFLAVLLRAADPHNVSQSTNHMINDDMPVTLNMDDNDPACTGITSTSITTGFKEYLGRSDGVFQKPAQNDVELEEYVNPDGSQLSILRSKHCTKRRKRGTMCAFCRAAQNRWAVRLCRAKKVITKANGTMK